MTTNLNTRRLRWTFGGSLLAVGVAVAGIGAAYGDGDKHDEKKEEKQAPKAGLYPLETCPLSGKKLNAEGDPVIYDYKGRELRFSSKDCIKAFQKDPEGSITKIDAAIIQQQLPGYPMSTCPVSGDKLGGDMGAPIDRVYQNRLVRFCCPDCLKDFEKDPAKFLAKLDAEILSKQKPNYPLATCPVSGDKLEGEMGPPIDYVFAGRLVRFCCPDCMKDFVKDPWKFMAKIDEAAKGKPKDQAPKGDDNDDDHEHHHEHKH